MSPPFSVSKNKPSKDPARKQEASRVLNPEEAGDIFLRNVG
jgi:hypothetical protein